MVDRAASHWDKDYTSAVFADVPSIPVALAGSHWDADVAGSGDGGKAIEVTVRNATGGGLHGAGALVVLYQVVDNAVVAYATTDASSIVSFPRDTNDARRYYATAWDVDGVPLIQGATARTLTPAIYLAGSAVASSTLGGVVTSTLVGVVGASGAVAGEVTQLLAGSAAASASASGNIVLPAAGLTLVQDKAAASASFLNLYSATYDTTPVAGNLLVSALAIRVSDVPTVPPGWTLAKRVLGSGPQANIAYKIADGTESVVEWDWTNNSNPGIWIAEFNGNAASPLDSEGNGNSGLTEVTSQVCTLATTTQAVTLLVSAWALRGADTTAHAVSRGAIEASVHAGGSGGIGLVVAIEALTAIEAPAPNLSWTLARRAAAASRAFKAA